MSNIHRLVALILSLLAPAVSWAQTSSDGPRVFAAVQVGSNEDDTRGKAQLAGITLAAGLNVGVDWRVRGIEVDVTVPKWHVSHGLPQRFQYVGQSSGFEQQGHFYETVVEEKRRSVEVALLHRRLVPVGRIATVTWVVGGAYLYRPHETTTVTSEVLADGQFKGADTSHYESTRNYLAAVAGVEVELRLARSVSVVPRVRMTLFPSLLDDSGFAPRALALRPEVAVRWRCGSR